MLLATTRLKPSFLGQELCVDRVARSGDRAGAERQRVGFVASGCRDARDRAAAVRRG